MVVVVFVVVVVVLVVVVVVFVVVVVVFVVVVVVLVVVVVVVSGLGLHFPVVTSQPYSHHVAVSLLHLVSGL